MNISHFSSWDADGGLLGGVQPNAAGHAGFDQQQQFAQPMQPQFQEPQQPEQPAQPTMQRFNYQFCPNKVNPYHSCTEYCLQKYWPGNRRYRFQFCPNQNSHYCDLRCAQEHGPKGEQVNLQPNQFAEVQDPKMRQLIYCLMYYGY
jgi:hypothetical protein